jgi:hypothetical protein
LIQDFQPALGDTFAVITATSGIVGEFGALDLPELLGNLAWRVIYEPNQVSLVALLPGDYNFDGVVNAADYTVWRNTLGQAVLAGTGADGSGPGGAPDGMVTAHDYTNWKSRYGNTAGSGASVGDHSEVPEPSAAVMLFVGIALLVHGKACRLRRGILAHGLPR